MVGGERTTRASTAYSLKLRRANARRPLTHANVQGTDGNDKKAARVHTSKHTTGCIHFQTPTSVEIQYLHTTYPPASIVAMAMGNMTIHHPSILTMAAYMTYIYMLQVIVADTSSPVHLDWLTNTSSNDP